MRSKENAVVASPIRKTTNVDAAGKRRTYVRYFACGQDLSHEPMSGHLPPAVTDGREPFIVLGAISGG